MHKNSLNFMAPRRKSYPLDNSKKSNPINSKLVNVEDALITYSDSSDQDSQVVDHRQEYSLFFSVAVSFT